MDEVSSATRHTSPSFCAECEDEATMSTQCQQRDNDCIGCFTRFLRALRCLSRYLLSNAFAPSLQAFDKKQHPLHFMLVVQCQAVFSPYPRCSKINPILCHDSQTKFVLGLLGPSTMSIKRQTPSAMHICTHHHITPTSSRLSTTDNCLFTRHQSV